ncbi:MAG: hypothetical protein O2955_02525 [Planctomycetota bacterium]|nr:hypothetical protein [Planctomycetota bacterium]
MWRSETDEINEDDRRYRHYLDGGIIFRPRETVLPTPGYFSDDTSGPGHMPLLWQTNFRDFEKWWRLRQQLQFSLARHPQGFVVRCTGDSKQWRPAIEVWKENHVATLPWVGHDYLWKTGQHVWKKEQHKHPAGLFCLARMSEQSHYSGFEVGLKRTA